MTALFPLAANWGRLTHENIFDNGQEPFDVHYREGSGIGYKWYDINGYEPAFCFGHGLSYTAFGYPADARLIARVRIARRSAR